MSPARPEAFAFSIPLLLGALDDKARHGLAGFGAELDRGSWSESDGLGVLRARLLVNGRAGQHLVMRRRTVSCKQEGRPEKPALPPLLGAKRQVAGSNPAGVASASGGDHEDRATHGWLTA